MSRIYLYAVICGFAPPATYPEDGSFVNSKQTKQTTYYEQLSENNYVNKCTMDTAYSYVICDKLTE